MGWVELFVFWKKERENVFYDGLVGSEVFKRDGHRVPGAGGGPKPYEFIGCLASYIHTTIRTNVPVPYTHLTLPTKRIV